MPDHSELTAALAYKAFEIIGKETFTVSACLDVSKSETLRNFGLLESILLMAYNEGKLAASADPSDTTDMDESMSETHETPTGVREATEIRISMVSVDCPHCEASQGGWIGDPRDGEHTCDECGGVYRVPEDVRLCF